ncbi:MULTISPECIES: MFS transporter [unclassified Bradyrhizobium]|uniref:MFS transporter n=1 Tax=unclassified Bradyrhizobium TaxID=2631580 RepID=UPI001BA903DE|nr:MULTISPECIES: MFS transporter [unclassified Bradyrhizobium]MBR1207958.1 MFS transporter [Bradyrhizobium sp. AUGA SZCCT0124]MBR1314534.1 MFS transporter [Bradyrhizobium sp. AUGA SZCCT0051]MBR1342448.1 MFS transporter [Bradyrhizobium sp. AUGA SZCCT0105]MBR1352678.1 MFS transporter [Bradyrhizobium sp. AUGA SZCCT0045]
MSEIEAETIGLAIGADARPRSRVATPRQVLAIVSVGICLANLDLFIVNVGLPNIAQEFRGASLEDLSWILNGYAIVYAALLVFFGRLAERHSRNLSFLLGVALFTAASAACALAPNVELLVVARIAQAAGAALMTPTSIGLLLASFPPDQRPGAVRTWTAIGGLAAALGPLAGGVLVTFDWRWIFIVNVPIGIVALIIGWLKLPEVPGHDVPRPSSWAALLVTCGIGALTLAIVKANDWGWGSRGVALGFAIAAVSLAAFTWHCLNSKNPFVDPALFKVRPFTGATFVMAPYSAAFGAMLLSVALWEQTVWGWSALKTGLAIAPGPLLVPFTSLLFARRLIARFGAAAVVSAGIASFAGGLAIWATLLGVDPDMPAFVVGMMFTGIGVGLTFPTLMGVGAGSLPPSSFATGSGVINMIRQAALAIGVAIFVAILATPVSMADRIAAFQRGWWIMIAITIAGFVPNYLFIRRKADR